MKQDYLWDKTGSDDEIERLENALTAFRYKETAPPEILPAKVTPFKKQPPRRSFLLAYAVAACAAFAMIGWGAWYQFSGYEMEIQENLVETIQPPIHETPQRPAPVVEKKDDLLAVNNEATKQMPERRLIRSNKIASVSALPKPKKVKRFETETSEASLTKEEKYAYDQLMLALSITSSKLKMVKDKVQGADEETEVVEKGR